VLNTVDSQGQPLRATPLNAAPLLAKFESLLALTNLASADEPTSDAVTRAAWPQIEDLLLSDNLLVQRAAVELTCNLCAAPQGIEKFADGSGQAAKRLHILLALADAEDSATRSAAGGALAMLTEQPSVVEMVLKREKGVKVLVDMCVDEQSGDLKHRGLVCVNNLVSTEGEVGALAKKMVSAEGAKERIKVMLGQTNAANLLTLGISILKALG
jgi:protein unc-45